MNRKEICIADLASKIVCDSISAIKFDDNYSIKSRNKVIKKTIELFDNISLCLSDNFGILQKMLDNEILGDLFDISGAATVSETYEMVKYLHDNKSKDVDDTQYLKFVNTGTIDKFTTAWGEDEMTYVKQKYLYPVINKKKLKNAFPRRYQQGITPKLITTGIRYFEVFGDFEGKYMAAKSTEIITAKTNMDIKTVLPILNSNVVFFFLKEAYGGMAMGGGITFSPDNLSKIPIPKVDENARVKLYQLADKYELGFDEESQNELDEYVCNLYGLDEQEKNIINSFKLKTKRKR